jgi:5-methyltetrahydrofolate--homocysteine methyltransferase
LLLLRHARACSIEENQTQGTCRRFFKHEKIVSSVLRISGFARNLTSQDTMKLLETILSGRPLLADGATGTMLQGMGLPVGEAPERWTLEKPDAIRKLAQLYVGAGSDIIYTNTFGASSVHLARLGLEKRVVEVNAAAVKLAREANPAFVVGSIGPTGEMLEPYGDFSAEAAKESFLEQAQALASAGVDGLVCETFTDLTEALMAVEAASVTKLPVLASMAFDANGRTMMGVTPDDAVTQLTAAGACVVGTNCSVGPDAMEQVIRAMKAVNPNARLLAKPNAGMPKVVNGQAVYDVSPSTLAEFASKMKSLGVAVIGGCCGTTPAHLKAMREVLK